MRRSPQHREFLVDVDAVRMRAIPAEIAAEKWARAMKGAPGQVERARRLARDAEFHLAFASVLRAMARELVSEAHARSLEREAKRRSSTSSTRHPAPARRHRTRVVAVH